MKKEFMEDRGQGKDSATPGHNIHTINESIPNVMSDYTAMLANECSKFDETFRNKVASLVASLYAHSPSSLSPKTLENLNLSNHKNFWIGQNPMPSNHLIAKDGKESIITFIEGIVNVRRLVIESKDYWDEDEGVKGVRTGIENLETWLDSLSFPLSSLSTPSKELIRKDLKAKCRTILSDTDAVLKQITAYFKQILDNSDLFQDSKYYQIRGIVDKLYYKEKAAGSFVVHDGDANPYKWTESTIPVDKVISVNELSEISHYIEWMNYLLELIDNMPSFTTELSKHLPLEFATKIRELLQPDKPLPDPSTCPLPSTQYPSTIPQTNSTAIISLVDQEKPEKTEKIQEIAVLMVDIGVQTGEEREGNVNEEKGEGEGRCFGVEAVEWICGRGLQRAFDRGEEDTTDLETRSAMDVINGIINDYPQINEYWDYGYDADGQRREEDSEDDDCDHEREAECENFTLDALNYLEEQFEIERDEPLRSNIPHFATQNSLRTVLTSKNLDFIEKCCIFTDELSLTIDFKECEDLYNEYKTQSQQELDAANLAKQQEQIIDSLNTLPSSLDDYADVLLNQTSKKILTSEEKLLLKLGQTLTTAINTAKARQSGPKPPSPQSPSPETALTTPPTLSALLESLTNLISLHDVNLSELEGRWRKEVDYYKGRVEEMGGQINVLHGIVTDKDRVMRDMDEGIKGERKRAKEAEEALAQTKSLLEAKELQLSDKHMELDAEIKNKNSLQEKYNKTEGKLKTNETELKNVQNLLKTAEDTLQTFSMDNGEKNKEIISLKSKISGLEGELEAEKQKVTQLSKELQNSTEENQKLTKTIQDLNANLLQSQADLKEQVEVGKVLRANIESARVEMEGMWEKIRESEERIKERDEGIRVRDEALKECEKRLKSESEELKKTKEELEGTKQKLKGTEGDLGNTKDELQNTKGELKNTKDELQKTMGELKNTRDELKKTDDNLKKTDNKLETTNKSLEYTQELLKAAKSDLANIEETLATTTATLQTTQSENQSLQSKLLETEASLETTKISLQEKTAELSETSNNLSHTSSRLSQLNEDFENSEKSLKILQKAYRSQQKIIEDLDKKIEEMNN